MVDGKICEAGGPTGSFASHSLFSSLSPVAKLRLNSGADSIRSALFNSLHLQGTHAADSQVRREVASDPVLALPGRTSARSRPGATSREPLHGHSISGKVTIPCYSHFVCFARRWFELTRLVPSLPFLFSPAGQSTSLQQHRS